MTKKFCHNCDCEAPKGDGNDSFGIVGCPQECYCCLHGHTDLCPK